MRNLLFLKLLMIVAIVAVTAFRVYWLRESNLLMVLYENRDRIIDRKEILNLLWGNDNFFNSRNLDVYVTKLRSYLKEDSSVEIITVKGIGYRFVIS